MERVSDCTDSSGVCTSDVHRTTGNCRKNNFWRFWFWLTFCVGWGYGRNTKIRLGREVSRSISFLVQDSEAQLMPNCPKTISPALVRQEGRCSGSWILVPGTQNKSVNLSAKMVVKHVQGRVLSVNQRLSFTRCLVWACF